MKKVFGHLGQHDKCELCNSNSKLIIAKDDFPLEQIIDRPITNFFRRLFLSSHKECHKCYEERKGIKVE